jgi:hypothetical protein
MPMLVVRPFAAGTALALALVLAIPACSSNEAAPDASCVDARCAAGNKCLPLNGETKCRKVCTSNSDPQTACPFGYTCVAPESGEEAFCQQDQALNEDGSVVTRSAKGQWGAACNPVGGVVNPDCDTAQGFYCFGTSQTDASAYCTRYACETDRNCGAGFGCSTVNTTPNVERTKRGRLAAPNESGVGEVHKVCLRREYCSTCKVDLDCPPAKGLPQHCVADAEGNGFCAPECDSTKSCALDARCADIDGRKVCYPRAQRCVGDGSLCSPCRSDADCGADGACITGAYTSERYCAKRSTTPCSAGSPGSCPATVKLATEVVASCTTKPTDLLPADYCLGLYEIGAPTCGENQNQPCYYPGCWTPNRQ